MRLYIVGLFCLLNFLSGQKTRPEVVKTKTDTIVVEKLVVPKSEYDKVIKQYIEILEKTNSQLNFGWIPLNTAISFLGILIGFAAIFSGYFIWKQSKEAKALANQWEEKLKISSEKYKKQIDELMNNLRLSENEIKEKAQVFMTVMKQKLDSLSGEANNENTQNQIDEIEKSINEFNKKIFSPTTSKRKTFVCNSPFSCYNCKEIYYQTDQVKDILDSGVFQTHASSICPNCGCNNLISKNEF